MMIRKLSLSESPLHFIKEFCELGSKIHLSQKRPTHNASFEQHTINLFKDSSTELAMIYKNTKNPVARVMLHKKDQKTAYFGLFDFYIDEHKAADILFQVINDWCRQNNILKVIGPVDFNVWMGHRFKKEGHKHRFVWEPDTPEIYYLKALEHKFVIDKSYSSSFYNNIEVTKARTQKGYNHSLKSGFTFSKIDIHEQTHLRELYRINIEGFSKNYLYTPISLEQYLETHIRLLKNKETFNPKSQTFNISHFILGPNKMKLGYIYAFIDSNFLIIKSLVIDPHYRRHHLSSALIHQAILCALKFNIGKIVGACIRDGNISEVFCGDRDELEFRNSYVLCAKTYGHD